MRILHISADYPDPLRPAKTRAVANLLDLVPEHRHFVYSLNRVDWRHDIAALPFGTGAHRALAYGAMPKGLMMVRGLAPVADWIAADADRRDLRPALVHAHKLSVEGLVGREVAVRLGVPLVVSSQGNSDLKIIGAKPSLRPAWRRIWRDAAAVLPFAPWTAEGLARLLGPREGPIACLPCPSTADEILAPRPGPSVVRAIFGLDELANKNAALLIRAAGPVARTIPGFRLEIVGGGDAESFARLARLARGAPWVSLRGPIGHDRVQKLMNESACVAVPSRRESYGMVFAEALLAGCPVLHGRGNGITGYFPGAGFAVEAPPGGPAALAGVLVDMLERRVAIKSELADAQRAGRLDRLRRPAIAASYRVVLDRVVSGCDAGTIGRAA